MSPYYLKPHYPIAKLVADQVRAFDSRSNGLLSGFSISAVRTEPMTVRATNLKRPAARRGPERPGEPWLAEYDYTEDYR